MNPALIDVRSATTSSARRLLRPPEPPSTGVVARDCLRPARTPWWLWPHLLSLDAPLVALVWQRWWARVAGVALPPSRVIVLGLGVWLIYLVDRLVDAADLAQPAHGTARHAFAGTRRKLLRPLALLIALTLTALTPCWLPGVEFRAGLGLLALALGYYWLIHCRTDRAWAAYFPKEAVVGAMFGAGSAFFVVCRAPHLRGVVWLDFGLFAAVCFLNCALITKWERHDQDLRERFSLLNAFPGLSARLGLACGLLAATALAVSATTGSLASVPVAASALLLLGLDRCETSLSTDALRVLADMVLLTPLIGLLCTSAIA